MPENWITTAASLPIYITREKHDFAVDEENFSSGGKETDSMSNTVKKDEDRLDERVLHSLFIPSSVPV